MFDHDTRPTHESRPHRRTAALLAALAALAAPAAARADGASGTETHAASYVSAVATSGVAEPVLLEFPRFDDRDGTRTLERVRLAWTVEVAASVAITNESIWQMYARPELGISGVSRLAIEALGPLEFDHDGVFQAPLLYYDSDADASSAFSTRTVEPALAQTIDELASSSPAVLAACTGTGALLATVTLQDFAVELLSGQPFSIAVEDAASAGVVTITYEYRERPDPCRADRDGSGTIGFGDLMAMLEDWGACPTGADCPADVDGDGQVGMIDLVILTETWGPCS